MLETSLDDEMTKLLDIASLCGFSDWITGITKIVGMAKCNAELIDASQTLYTIIKVTDEDGTAKLLFGDRGGENDGSSPGKRPKVLDALREYTKR